MHSAGRQAHNPRVPRHFRGQVVASKGQRLAHRGSTSPPRPVWEPVEPCVVFLPSLTTPPPTLPACVLAVGTPKGSRGGQGRQSGWEARVPGHSSKGSRPWHSTPPLQ